MLGDSAAFGASFADAPEQLSPMAAGVETGASEIASVITPRPDGRFDIDQHKAEQRAATARHKQELEAVEAAHRRSLEARRDAQRLRQQQYAFFAVILVLGASLVIALAVALVAENDDRQEWAQSIVTLIIGGVVGGMAGYITGQSSKS